MEKSDNNYYLIKFQIEVFNVVFNTAISSLENRFNMSSKFMVDLACLHPSRFEEVQYLSTEPLERLSSYLKKFDPSITSLKLYSQLKDFAQKWDTLRLSLNDEYLKKIQHF